MGREELPAGQGEYRREQLPGRQVAGGAEHHHGKWLGHTPMRYEGRAIHGVLVWSRCHFLLPPDVEPFRGDQPKHKEPSTTVPIHAPREAVWLDFSTPRVARKV